MEAGTGSVGVEFAGTAVSSPGQNLKGPIEQADNSAQGLTKRNNESIWQERYCRGYFLLNVAPEKVSAQLYGRESSVRFVPEPRADLQSQGPHQQHPVILGTSHWPISPLLLVIIT